MPYQIQERLSSGIPVQCAGISAYVAYQVVGQFGQGQVRGCLLC
jgi:hypothetical protein